MTSNTLLPLHFATHLFTLTVAIAAGFVLARRAQGTVPSRIAGALGFGALAVAELLHGAAVIDDLSNLGGYLRTAGAVLVLGSALLSRPAEPAFAALGVIVPPRAAIPAIAAMAAGVALGWRAREDRGGVAMGAGLVMIGAAESLLVAHESGVRYSLLFAHIARAAGWALVAVGVMSATRRSIRFRYVASFVAVLLVVVLAVSSAITRVIGDNLREETAKRVEAETNALASRFEPEAVDAVVSATAAARGVSNAVLQTRDAARRLFTVIRDLLPRVDFIVGVTPGGEVIAYTDGMTEAEAIELAGSDVRESAQTTMRPGASLDALGPNGLVITGAALIDRTRPGRGVLLVGARVDDDLLQSLSPATEGFVIRNAFVSASSLRGFPRGSDLPAELRDRVEREVIERGESIATSTTLNGVEYFVAARPLARTDDAGAVVGALIGTEPTEILAATERGVNRVLFLVTLGAVAVAILLSLAFGRRFTRPVRQLTAAARRVQAGDLTTKAPVSGEDEVGDLSRAFNAMTSSLAATTDSLQLAVEEESRLRDQLETVLDSMGDGLVAVDTAGRVVTWNPAAEKLIGLSRAKASGRELSDVLVGRTAQGRPLTGKEVPSGFAFIRRKGAEVPVAIVSSPIRASHGEELGRVYVLRDRSQEAEVERVKREFLATVSHELRTPLTPIVGYAELLTRRDFDAPRVEEFARGILSSARRMERIVAMLLDFSAIEAGRMPVEPEAVALRPLVVRAVDEWRERAPDHRFQTRFAAGAPQAMVDVPLFRRTMDELLDNAVKYSPDGGTITVAVKSNGAPKGKHTVQVEVSDEGIGIPAKQLPGIFQDFRQLDGSDTRTFGGLGLGLAFVKRIVQAHRGTISAESRPGKGTTFKIGLPAAETGQRGT